MTILAFCQGLAFHLCVAPSWWRGVGFANAFGSWYSRFALVAYFSQAVLNRVFDKDYDNTGYLCVSVSYNGGIRKSYPVLWDRLEAADIFGLLAIFFPLPIYRQMKKWQGCHASWEMVHINVKGALDKFNIIPTFSPKKLGFLYH